MCVLITMQRPASVNVKHKKYVKKSSPGGLWQVMNSYAGLPAKPLSENDKVKGRVLLLKPFDLLSVYLYNVQPGSEGFGINCVKPLRQQAVI